MASDTERATLAELADELEAEKPCGGYTAANAIALSPDTVALLAPPAGGCGPETPAPINEGE